MGAAQSVQRLTTGWTVRDRIPMGTRFSDRPDRSWGPPSLLYNEYRVFPGGKVRPGRAADHSPPSSAAVMEEQSYTSTHPLGHTGPVTGSLYPYLIISMLRMETFVPRCCTVHWQTTARTMLSVRVRKIWGITLELSDGQILKSMDAAGALRIGQKVRVRQTRRYLPQHDLRGRSPPLLRAIYLRQVEGISGGHVWSGCVLHTVTDCELANIGRYLSSRGM